MPRIPFIHTSSSISVGDVDAVCLVSPDIPCEFQPPRDDSILGQSGDESSFKCCKTLGFTILLLNVRSINSKEKRAMLSAHLERFSPEYFSFE